MARESLDIRLLGQFSVVRAGQPAALPPSRKTRALLAYLAMTGRAQRRDQLCSMFWNVPDDPRGALRWSLSKIRALVDDGDERRLHADRETVRFEPRGARIDALALKASAGEVSRLRLDALIDLAGAIDGEFLAGLELPDCEAYQAWSAAQREDLRGAASKVLRALTERLRRQPSEALPYARRLVEIDPFDSEVRVQLIRLLADAGRRQEAEQQFALGVEALSQAGLPVQALNRAKRELEATAAPALAAPSVAIAGMAAAGSSAHLVEPQIHFCRARDGVRLAYATVGSGPPLLKAAHWMNHLEYDWRHPGRRPMIEMLAARHTLIRYDGRGNGLSDWDVADMSFEASVEDLAAVAEANGASRFPLFGISQGSAVSVAYAVRYPERVERLILYGGYARGWKHRDDQADVERKQALLTLMRLGWSQDNPAYRQVFTTLHMPDATPEHMQWFNELQRHSSSPENAVRVAEAGGDIDLRALLPKVRVPTLVIHGIGDAIVPFSEGRELAAAIPGARFLSLDSTSHVALAHEPAWPVLVAHIQDFLAAS